MTYEHPLYREDLKKICDLPLAWSALSGKTILLSGATGMIGTCLIDALMEKNRESQMNISVLALGRSREKARQRFASYWDSSYFRFLECDIDHPLSQDIPHADYVIHAASNTHPVAYAKDPVGTIMANVVGTGNLLDFAVREKADRFLFLSSVEIYGENRTDVELFSEDYLGYIDCNTLRAGYPESKRTGEALCQAYGHKYGLDFVIPRLSRVYGPTLLPSDTKALSQFIRKGVAGENIVLKSEGTQLFSYTYVADVAGALLTLLLEGKSGEAYNVADEASNLTLRELAELIARLSGTKVVFDLPEAIEQAGYSKATKALLDPGKINGLGWKARYPIQEGVRRTLEILNNREE